MAITAIEKASIEPDTLAELRAQRKDYMMSFMNKHLKRCYVGGNAVHIDAGQFRMEGIEEELINEIITEYEASGWTVVKQAQILIMS